MYSKGKSSPQESMIRRYLFQYKAHHSSLRTSTCTSFTLYTCTNATLQLTLCHPTHLHSCHIHQQRDGLRQLMLPLWQLIDLNQHPQHSPDICSHYKFTKMKKYLSNILKDDMDPNPNHNKSKSKSKVMEH